MVKDELALISLRQLTGKETTLDQVRANGKGAREPPMAPEPFATELADGVASGAKGFTNKGDVGLVTTVYDKAFDKEMGQAVKLVFQDLQNAEDAVGLQQEERAGTE